MSFEFLREGKVVLEHDSKFYLLHTTRDITFSQTFKQDSVRKRTLHSLSSFVEGSAITEANPANFSFTLYLVDETIKYQHIPLDLLITPDTDLTKGTQTFNLYFVYSDYSPEVYYKIENCMLTSGAFKIPRNGIMMVEMSGEGAKLTRNTGSFGTIYAGYAANPTYAISKDFDVYVGDGLTPEKLDNVLGASFEIQNSISWTKNTTVQQSINTTDESNTIYPSSFTTESKSFAGSIQQYVDETNPLSKDNLLTWKEGTSVFIKAGLSSSNYQVELTLTNSASFTNRVGFGEVFTQNYDFRLIDTPSDYSTIINY